MHLKRILMCEIQYDWKDKQRPTKKPKVQLTNKAIFELRKHNQMDIELYQYARLLANNLTKFAEKESKKIPSSEKPLQKQSTWSNHEDAQNFLNVTSKTNKQVNASKSDFEVTTEDATDNSTRQEKASTVNISEEEYQILKQAAKDNAATAKKLKDLQNKYLQLKEKLHAPGGS